CWLDHVAEHRAVCIEMPLPERSPLAHFVGIVEVAGAARVFTLERMEGDQPLQLLCEWTRKPTHHIRGAVEEATREAFVAAMASEVRRPCQTEGLTRSRTTPPTD